MEMTPYQQIAPLTQQQQQGMDLVSQITPWAQNFLGNAANQQQMIGANAGNAIGGQNTIAGNAVGNLGGQNALMNNAIGQLGNQNAITGNAVGQLGNENALANQYQQAGAGMASNIMGGGLMNPSDNQYLQQYFNAAAQPLTQQFQQTVAPGILQNAAQTGTLGSAGQAQAYGNAENALSQGLGNLAAGIYEPAYAQNLSATTGMLGQGMNTAANMYGQGLGTAASLLGQGMGNATSLYGQGMQEAGNIYGQQLQAAQNAGQMAPQLTNAMYQVPQQLMQSGATGQQQAQNVLNTAYQNLTGQANWPLQALSDLGQGLSTASGGGGTSVQVGTSPSSAAGK
jgi:hypothetical protein